MNATVAEKTRSERSPAGLAMAAPDPVRETLVKAVGDAWFPFKLLLVALASLPHTSYALIEAGRKGGLHVFIAAAPILVSAAAIVGAILACVIFLDEE